MFTKEYKLIKDLIVYCNDDLVLQNKLLFRMLDIKDKYINKNLTTEQLNNEYKKLQILQKELDQSDIKDHDNIYKKYVFIH